VLFNWKGHLDLGFVSGTGKKYFSSSWTNVPLDLLIRTGGDTRTSGFDSRGAKLLFSDEFFPNYTPDMFRRSLRDFQKTGARRPNVTGAAFVDPPAFEPGGKE
jgi:hypothetical protein